MSCSNLEVLDTIQCINTTYGVGAVHYYLNGGCYIFAKKLKNLVGGDLRYLTLENHFILELGNKLYDSTGNVTSKYSDSRYITEAEFNSRNKLRNSVKAF